MTTDSETQKKFERITEDLICSICNVIMDDPHALHCGHSFCGQCILTWLNVKKVCPMCRVKINRMPTHINVLQKIADTLRTNEESGGRLNESDWHDLFPVQSIRHSQSESNTGYASPGYTMYDDNDMDETVSADDNVPMIFYERRYIGESDEESQNDNGSFYSTNEADGSEVHSNGSIYYDDDSEEENYSGPSHDSSDENDNMPESDEEDQHSQSSYDDNVIRSPRVVASPLFRGNEWYEHGPSPFNGNSSFHEYDSQRTPPTPHYPGQDSTDGEEQPAQVSEYESDDNNDSSNERYTFNYEQEDDDSLPDLNPRLHIGYTSNDDPEYSNPQENSGSEDEMERFTRSVLIYEQEEDSPSDDGGDYPYGYSASEGQDSDNYDNYEFDSDRYNSGPDETNFDAYSSDGDRDFDSYGDSD